jgi:hypothetical protein
MRKGSFRKHYFLWSVNAVKEQESAVKGQSSKLRLNLSQHWWMEKEADNERPYIMPSFSPVSSALHHR